MEVYKGTLRFMAIDMRFEKRIITSAITTSIIATERLGMRINAVPNKFSEVLHLISKTRMHRYVLVIHNPSLTAILFPLHLNKRCASGLPGGQWDASVSYVQLMITLS
jgi:hypothetical protein